MKNTEKTMDQIVALCKGRGFVYPGSEIYGGLANSWDYGPLGVELKNNVKRAWWKKFVQENPYNVGLDAAILMNPEVWVASGHVSTFNDPLIDCKACKMRHRADKLIEGWCAENGRDDVNVEAMTNEELVAFIRDNGVTCPGCGKADFTDIRKFNLMFKTHQGVTEDSSTEVYLRPETAQGIFVNFPAIQRTTRKKLPFGVCQVGKSFRNEITPVVWPSILLLTAAPFQVSSTAALRVLMASSRSAGFPPCHPSAGPVFEAPSPPQIRKYPVGEGCSA